MPGKYSNVQSSRSPASGQTHFLEGRKSNANVCRRDLLKVVPWGHMTNREQQRQRRKSTVLQGAERTEPPWLICPGPAASTLGPHLKFRRQNSRGKQPALSAAARALYSVAPHPRHSTPPRGADNPTKGLMPEPSLQSAFSSR